MSAASAALPILDATGFPSEGTVLVDDELIHYTRIREGALEMPSASTVPGAMDGNGGGLFRGRFGTEPAGHRQGAPVILFPFRYWDRQAEHADAPELAYFGLAVDQPGAFWRSVFWDADEVEGTPDLRPAARRRPRPRQRAALGRRSRARGRPHAARDRHARGPGPAPSGARPTGSSGASSCATCPGPSTPSTASRTPGSARRAWRSSASSPWRRTRSCGGSTSEARLRSRAPESNGA